MSHTPNLSRLCLEHAPDPTGGKAKNKKPPNSLAMWQNVVPPELGVYKSRNKRQAEEQKRRMGEMKAYLDSQVREKESRRPRFLVS